jgi:hypothetical protein
LNPSQDEKLGTERNVIDNNSNNSNTNHPFFAHVMNIPRSRSRREKKRKVLDGPVVNETASNLKIVRQIQDRRQAL